MAAIDDVEIPTLLFAEQGSDPSTPASGFGRLYVKGTGLFFRGDGGAVVGPLAASAGGGGTDPVVTQYQPTTQTVLSTSSASFADVDATNAKWVFTAPSTGKVLLRASAYVDAVSTNLGSGDRYMWGIHNNTADVADTAQTIQRCQTVNVVEQGRTMAEWLVTGLTPTSSYTYKLRHRVDNAVVTGRLILGTKDAATTIFWGPLVMTVLVVA